jgi:hypothetical protein
MRAELPGWFPTVRSTDVSDQSMLLLAGSISMNEHDQQGRFGDADMYLVHQQGAGAGLPAAITACPRCHVVVLSEGQAGRLRPTFRLFEARERGVVLCGEDMRSALPQVRPDNLDVGDTNDILAWRILSCVRALLLVEDDQHVGYLAAKNLLDLGMWLSVQHGHLRSSHRERIELLQAEMGGSAALAALRSEWLAAAGEALSIKTGQGRYARPRDAAFDALALLKAAVQLLLDGAVPLTELSERSWRRRAAVDRNALLRVANSRLGLTEVKPFLTRPHGYLLEVALGTAERPSLEGLGRLTRTHDVVFGGATE